MRGHRHRLAAQALARVRVSRRLAWQQLDGDLTIEPRVAGAIDLAHASRPEGGQNLVGAESRAGRKRQTWQTGRILARLLHDNGFRSLRVQVLLDACGVRLVRELHDDVRPPRAVPCRMRATSWWCQANRCSTSLVTPM